MNVRTWMRPAAAAVVALVLGLPGLLQAQDPQIVACDFDIADELGRFTYGSTTHLVGRSGASSNRGEFFIINGNKPDQDVDRDGYALNCDYPDLFIPDNLRFDLINVADPTLVIPAQNIIVVNLPRTLTSGTMARVELFVEIPPGTVAGTYIGNIQIRDRVRLVSLGPNNEILGLDRLFVEVRVTEDRSVAIIDAALPEELDSVVVRGRAGQRASTVFRVANTGNTPLSDVRLSATDLRSESAVGLVIPASQVSFSTQNFSSIGVGDTARVTVTVNLPRNILSGRYRGSLLVQAENAEPREIPLIAIVTSSRGILFANNPVRSARGDIAQIAFNGDPGTAFEIGVFDMTGRLVWTDRGTVFPGTDGTPGDPGADADFAVNYAWPLTNGRGENIASGMYLVVVQSTVSGERQLARDRLMVIR